ncbi:MAG: hypothetical protein R6W70_09445 [bacterium]
MYKALTILSIIFALTFLSAESIKIDDNEIPKFFELYGYFSLNHKMTHNLIMNGNNPLLESTLLKSKETDDETGEVSLSDVEKEKLLSWARIKLHLQPVINVGETMEIHTKFSIFGNKVLGSDNFYEESRANGILRDTQMAQNSALQFEGLWGSVRTPFGELKAGRMPFHWGLGMLYNDGNKVTSRSSGDYIDRVQFTVPFWILKAIPAFDFPAEGISQRYRDYVIDPSQKDDAWQLSLMIMKTEDDESLFQQKLNSGKFVWEAGAMVMYSWKKNMSTIYTENEDGDMTDIPINETMPLDEDDPRDFSSVSQSAGVWKLDGWTKMHYKKLTLKAEIAFITGSTGKYYNSQQDTTHNVNIEAVGTAFEGEYRAIPETLHISLLTGLASPDNGNNSNIHSDAWNLPGNSIGNGNYDIKNFMFNRHYNINSSLWKEVLGRFTGGYYLSSHVEYFFLDTMKAFGGLTFSTALRRDDTIDNQGNIIGIEPFTGVFYNHSNGLRAGITYQMSIPFNGLSAVNSAGDLVEPDMLHTLHTFFGFVF